MKDKLKKMIPNKIKVILVKMLKPIKTIKALCNKSKYNNICKQANLKFYTDVEVVDKIISEKKSLARFGDGEWLWILNEKFESYQESSEELSNKLIDVLKSKNPNLILGLTNVFDETNLNKYVLSSRVHFINFIVKYFPTVFQYIDNTNIYADALISRCYIDYKNKQNAKERYSNIKRIWENKDILIVEGSKTKMGIGNDLLSNAKSIKRIVCPANNAFNKYNEIFETVKEYGKNKTILMALGPTATILAHDICTLNTTENIEYQAIDLGHLDIEYEWYIKGAKKREAIEGKFVNEVRNKDFSNIEKSNNEYKDSIIKTIN